MAAGSSTTQQPPKVGLVISGEKFEHWTEIEITQSIDSFSTATFTAPFEAGRKEFRELFRPFSYRSINVLIDDKVRFTGTMMGIEPRIDANSKSVVCTCYSLPGTLGDCCPPASAFPLEFNGMTLLQIAQQVCTPFGLRAKIADDVPADESDHAFTKKKMKRGPRGGRGKRGNKFQRCALEPGDNALEFLIKLAQQIGLVMGDDEVGNLVFRDSDASIGSPVARFVQGEPPLLGMAPEFRPQEYFSEIAAFTPATTKKKGTNFALHNPFTVGTQIIRPHCFKLNDVLDGTAAQAAWTKMGRMLGNAASWAVGGVPAWRDPDGTLWTAGKTVLASAPDAMVYRESEFLIRGVTLKQDAAAYTADFHLVLPGAFSGALPDHLPWEEPDGLSFP